MRNIILYLLLAITPCLYGFNKVDEQQLTTKNYITNGGAEQGRAGFVRYADAAATSPVDGTAGSPNASTTLTTTSSSPLAGTYSLLLTKDAVNRQGEGFSYDFTIDNQNQAKVLAISFDYSVSSAFVSGDSSDIRVWLYDKTNAVLIQPAPYTIQGGSTGTHRFQGNFQTASNSTSYRLIWHIATTNASAWTFKVDSIYVGREPRIYGSPVTDWALDSTFAPTGFGTVSLQSIWWRRVGDSMEVFGTFKAGTVGASTAYIALPSGISMDSAKITATVSAQQVGSYSRVLTGAATSLNTDATGSGALFSDATTYTQIFFNYQAASNAFNKVNGSTLASNSDSFTFSARFPVSGWSSSVEMSKDTDTRVVTARMNYAGSAFTLSNSTQATVKFDTVDFDTHGALTTGASPLFTVPVPGYYKVDADYEFATNATGQRAISLYKNGAQVSEINQTGNPSGTNGNRLHGTDTIKCVAGDTLAIFAFQSSGGNLNIGGSGGPYNYATFTRVSGPAAIAATETVAARGTNTAGTSISSGTDTLVPVVIDYDTHGSMSTSAVFTAPISGKYALKGCVSYNDAVGSGDLINLKFKKNASTTVTDMAYVVPTAGANQFGGCASDTVRLLAGDTIGMYVAQNSGAGRVLATGAGRNFYTVERIGAY